VTTLRGANLLSDHPFRREEYENCLLSYLRAALCAQVPSSVKDKSQFG